jgi:Cu+-exporting ATPase
MQGWDHALEQFDTDVWFVLPLAAGFGIQVVLFTQLRAAQARMAAGSLGMAASTGTSTAAMLACCAHHLSNVLPILGVSGAAVFLSAYQTPLLWLGLAMNLAGIAYLVWQLRGLGATASAVDQLGAPRRLPDLPDNDAVAPRLSQSPSS